MGFLRCENRRWHPQKVRKCSTALISMQSVIQQPLVWRKALVVQYEELWIQSSNGNKSYVIRRKQQKTVIKSTTHWLQSPRVNPAYVRNTDAKSTHTERRKNKRTHHIHTEKQQNFIKKEKNFHYSSLQSLQNNKANIQRH